MKSHIKKSYDPEFKARAVRMVQQHREDYRSLTAACTAIGDELGVSRETLRTWVRQVEVDAGNAPGVTTDEHEEIARLRKENKRLREANEILKKAFFARQGITVQRVMTDNGACYRSYAFAAALGDDVRHIYTRPYRPQTNGKVERFNRTLMQEWAYARPYLSEQARQATHEAFVREYNYHRDHTAIGGSTPR